jgi:hypothetical protein
LVGIAEFGVGGLSVGEHVELATSPRFRSHEVEVHGPVPLAGIGAPWVQLLLESHRHTPSQMLLSSPAHCVPTGSAVPGLQLPIPSHVPAPWH